MKKLFLGILCVGFATYANAQKSEVAEAKKAWGIFQITGGKQTFDKTMEALENGLKHTDNAIANEKSKELLETWVYRSLFSSAIAVTDTVNAQNSLAKQKIAEEAIAKAKSLDTKSSEKENIQSAEINIANAVRSRAIMAYNKKDYATALNFFNELIAKNPNDTSMYINAGITAKLAEKYPEAIQHFKKVISFNGPQTRDFYIEVININLDKLKDTTAALAVIKEASVKYPEDADIIGIETDLYIKQNNIAKSQEALNKLIAKDPKKELYQYLMGDTYYKQALMVQDARKKIDAKKVKEYDAATAKMTALIDQSLPFYKKAAELNPTYVPALETLKQIYAFKSDMPNYEAIKKRLDAIPAN